MNNFEDGWGVGARGCYGGSETVSQKIGQTDRNDKVLTVFILVDDSLEKSDGRKWFILS